MSLGPYGDESGPAVHFCHTRSVRDAAAVLDAVGGPGVGDMVIAPPVRPYVRAGFPAALADRGLWRGAGVLRAVNEAGVALLDAGARFG